MIPFRAVGIAGLGQIGGSLARALARHAPGMDLVGLDPDPLARRVAERSGCFAGVFDGTQGLSIDLLILACPMPALLRLLDRMPRW